jgi:hypothetical protein
MMKMWKIMDESDDSEGRKRRILLSTPHSWCI